MKLPKLVSGWITSDKRVHESREEAYSVELRNDLKSKLSDALWAKVERRERRGMLSMPELTHDEIIEVLEQHYNIEPKHIEESE